MLARHYELWDHSLFLRDSLRLDAYVRAIRALTNEGNSVLDIGTGTGFFAIVAQKSGATFVDAIEPDEVIRVARGVVEANDAAADVTLYQCSMDDFVAPRRYNVIVSDLRGCLPFYGANITAAIRARELLADGGHMIPHTDRLYVAPVHLPEIFADYETPWTTSLHGIDLRFCRPFANSKLSITHASAASLLAEPRLWSTIDYQSIAASEHAGRLKWQFASPVVAQGYLAWFESTLAPGIELSNRPGSHPLVYGQLFFPLNEPVAMSPNESLHLDLAVRWLGDEQHEWTWVTEAHGARQFGSATS